jgi:transcriptional regulator with XRE-family HTH domain
VTSPRPVPENRIKAVMDHTTRYAFEGQSKLAADAGVARSTISRLLSGQSAPSSQLLLRVTRALEVATGRPLDPRDLVSFDGTYPTSYVCELVGCKGCLPDAAFDQNDNLKTEWKGVEPGRWSTRKEEA